MKFKVVILMPLLMCVHYLIISSSCVEYLPCWSDKLVNETIALVLNVLGTGIVVHSISSNLGTIRPSWASDILKEFNAQLAKLMGRGNNINISATFGGYRSQAYEPEISITEKDPTTVAELHAYVQKEIKELKNEAAVFKGIVDEKITKLSTTLNDSLDITKNDIQTTKKQLSEVAVGGAETQLLGVLLLIYGSVVSYFA
ncbi:hypothetical protein [Agarivorans sp. QJM3NY_25]|uniref:hypothetical protein n=1 Tax=Agarivorans sp. QJM3NY_25 TaxID=3421430 RepID=UPI003D7C506C